MKEHGDVISTISIAHKIIHLFTRHPDVANISLEGEGLERWVVALSMVDGTTVTVSVKSDYDPGKDPHA